MRNRIIVALALLAIVAGAITTSTNSTNSAQLMLTTSAMATTCAPAPPTPGYDIKIMGDSLTTPYGASSAAKSWPVMLQAQAATRGWTVGLHGIGSTMAEQYLPGGPHFDVTEAVRNSQPDLVLMDWRANEQLQGRTPDELKTALGALIGQIKQASPATKFMIVSPPVMWYHEFVSPAKQATYVDKMREVAQEQDACWVDLRPYFETDGGPSVETKKWLFDDIHLSDAGHKVFFAVINTAFLQACPM